MRTALAQNVFLSLQHAFTDLISAYVVIRYLDLFDVGGREVMTVIFLYNFLAFATQYILGYISDKYHLAQLFTLISALLLILSLSLVQVNSLLPVIIVGIGNAMFHVGGASVVLSTSKRKALFAGVFIAPGALGLLLGTSLVNSGNVLYWLFLVGVIFLLLDLYYFKILDYRAIQIPIKKATVISSKFVYVFIALFLIVLLRSLIGFSIPFPWRSTFPNALVLMTIFIFFGKIFGGALAEKFGLIKTGILSLALSIPLIILGIDIPLSGMTGVFLFQMTTAITLILIYSLFPNNPGTSLGFTTLALFLGALPMITNNLEPIKNAFFLGISGFLAVSLMIFVGRFTRRLD